MQPIFSGREDIVFSASGHEPLLETADIGIISEARLHDASVLTMTGEAAAIMADLIHWRRDILSLPIFMLRKDIEKSVI